MKKITFLLTLLISSLSFSQSFPIDFEDATDDSWTVFNGAAAAVIDDGSTTNNVLALSSGAAGFDGAALALETPVDLSDNLNNTISFTIDPQDDTLGPNEETTHLIKFEGGTGGVASTELYFTATGPDEQTVFVNFGSGLGTFSTIVIFPNAGDGNGAAGTFWLDDLNVVADYAEAPVVTASTPPSRDALDVVSFYSDSYSESTESGYGQVDVFGTRLEETIDGNNFYKLNNGYQYNYYANSGSVDLSATTNLHFDYYLQSIPNDATIKVLLLDDNNNNEYQIEYTAVGEWVSVDVPFSDFTNTSGGTDYSAIKIVQLGVVGFSDESPVYIDNLYFYNQPTSNQALITDFEAGSNNNWGAFNGANASVIDDGSGSNNVLELTSGGNGYDGASNAPIFPVDLSDELNNTVSITIDPQDDSLEADEERSHLLKFEGGTGGPAVAELYFTTVGPEEQTVLINFGPGLGAYTTMVIFLDAGDGNIATGTYWLDDLFLVSDPVVIITGPTVAASTPPVRSGDVVSFYSDSYTESTESGYGQVDVFGTRLEETIDGNNFYKLNNGYQYNYYANSGSVDLSATPYVHLDYFLESIPENSEIDLILFDENNRNEYSLTLSTVGEWVSVDVPFSDFTNISGGTDYSTIKIVQLGIVGFSDESPVYIDNLYFYYVQPGLITDFEASSNNNWGAFNGANASVIDDGSGSNNVLELTSGGNGYDGASNAPIFPVDLSDELNNTVSITIDPQDDSLEADEERSHLLKFEGGTGGSAVAELYFTTVGPEEQTVLINFGPGLGAYTTMVIFLDAGDGNIATGTYWLDDLFVIADAAATCDDGIQNGDETGVDCGGPDCEPCQEFTVEGVWQMVPEAGAFGVGASQGQTNYFSNPAADVVTRSCYFDDTFVFNSDNSFSNTDGGETWLETWQGVEAEQCGSSVAPHDGSNPATWAYDSSANTITLDGVGAYLGLAKVINGSELAAGDDVPALRTYIVTELTATTMTLDINVGESWWRFKLRKYLPPTCDDGIQNGEETGVDCGGPECEPCQIITVEGEWQIVPEAGAFGVGESQGQTNYFSNAAADVVARSCYFDDTFVFNSDNSFSNTDGGETWLETWQGVEADQCGPSVAPHDGSNPATWAYDSSANTITLDGVGAYLGIPKAINGAELAAGDDVPVSRTYLVTELTATTMILDIEVGGGAFWRFRLQRYVPPSPGPTDAAPVPTAYDTNTYSVYNDTNNYTNFLPIIYQFGDGLDSQPDLDPGDGINLAYKFNLATGGFGQGEGGPDDVSDKNFVSFDYFADTGLVGFKLVLISNDGGVTEHNYQIGDTGSGDQADIVTGTWTKAVIPMSYFTDLGFSSTHFFQWKVDPYGSDINLGGLVWIDNILFTRVDPSTVGPVEAAPIPTTEDANTYSVYNDTNNYTNFLPIIYQFGDGLDSQPDLDPGDGINLAYKFNLATGGFGQGEGGPDDVSDKNFVSFDYFADTGLVGFKLVLISNDGGVTEHNYQIGDTGSGDQADIVTETWAKAVIPMSYFTDLGFSSTHFFQWKVDPYGSDINLGGLVWIDNILFTTGNPTLSLDNYDMTKVSIYPNPTNGTWNINSTTEIRKVVLFDILGNRVFTSVPNAMQATIDATSFRSGVYFAKIESVNGIKTLKLIRE